MSARPTKSASNRIADLDDKNSITTRIGSQKYQRRTPGQAESVFPQYTAQGARGGFAQVFPEKFPTLNHGDLDGTRIIDIDLNKFFCHVTKFKLIGATPITQQITISNPPPAALSMLFFVEVTQDANGGHIIQWPAGVLPTPVIDTAANAKTLVALFTTDNGLTYHTQVFGASGGGSSGFENPAIEDLDMNGFDIFDVGEIRGINSILQKIISKATGWELEVPDGDTIDFFVDRTNNPTKRFGILETRLDSNVELDMNGQNIRDVLALIFGSPGTTSIDLITDELRFNTELNDKYAFRFNNGARFLIDDLIRTITMVAMDLVMTGGRIFTIQDTVSTRALQFLHLFGNQIMNYSDVLKITTNATIDDRLQIDTLIRPFVDIDMQENDILNIRTLQVEEEFGAGFAPGGVTDNAIIFSRPDGAGKTELRVKFQTGNSVLIAVEP